MNPNERELLIPTAVKDESDLTQPEIEARVPVYVLRLLCGGKMEHSTGIKKAVKVLSCGHEYIVSEAAAKTFELVKERVIKEELEPKGICAPYNCEDLIRIINTSVGMAREYYSVNPKKIRVYFKRMDNGGCGFYRVMQPVKFLNKHCEMIHAEQSDWLNVNLGRRFDVIVAPRVSNPAMIAILKELMTMGRLVIYESDDLLSKIPDWNPNKDEQYGAYRQHFIEKCSSIIVSTPELKDSLGRPDVSHVCMNGIDPEFWPMKVKEQKSGDVRILWGGSNTHEKDLGLIVPAVRRISKRYGKRVQFVFVNYLPNELSCAVKRDGKVFLGVAPEFRDNVTLYPGCPVVQWSSHLVSLNCDIAIAPLVQNEFNEAKSEIKVLEAWAMGIPVIASDIAPYKRAVSHGVNGILCPSDPDFWTKEITNLIEQPELRTKLAENGLKALQNSYVMPKIVEQYERAILRIARGKISRLECLEAIEQRLTERGWA